ncbi:hypothetical protein B0T20DRAFT_440355 [Sordaria brevicollis]|uniref:Rhodopsin domain-containing protein n=1 Tax=Sordaria brevicollis TaxID=83679 RepID=A0AAE0UAK0_SORBR|nr:hypothetical protein B0T20DRAFT_440355 [Sordaria brevicollis]
MYATMLTFDVIAMACMCLRFYSKRISKAKWFPDDYVLFVSWVVGTIYIGISLWMTRYGLGHPSVHLSKETVLDLKHYAPANTFMSITAVWVSKLSFFITLLRLVSGWQKKVPLWFFMTTCVLSLFLLSIMQSFYQCDIARPERNPCLAEGPINSFNIFGGVYSTLVDVLLSLVPTMVIWKVSMRPLERAAIICAMSTGLLAAVVSILKIYYNYRTLYGDTPRDPAMGGVTSALASVEVSCTIIAASIPFFRPLIRRMTGKDDSYQSYQSGQGGVASPMSASRQNSHTRKQDNANDVSVREIESGKRTPNYFQR